MKKEIKIAPLVYPQPVIMIATYNEDGSVDVMNAAWGGAADNDMIMISLSDNHATVKNLLRNKAVTISMPTAEYIKEADYFGMVSSLNTKDKFERTGLHAHKAETVNAPVIEEFPVCLECEFDSVDDYGIYFFKIKKAIAEEKVLDAQGNLNLSKCDGVLFDVATGKYFRIGEYLAKAFSIGREVKK